MRSREEIERMVHEEQANSTDPAEAAEARRRLAQGEDDDALFRAARERRGH
ncbi:hypothetical protein KUV85_00675 [Nocardioides panacisoli]|uniref:hypothetical protein n=1 Tax=Nocardioides panacisoli TaxID=627624 RepID=UPI001C625FB3|nr:hypothetical protein [Nocardioides panacisoli]QYJ04228.1 hypothetical protein KUV85_00675 [Nocardioides panacisoli]